MPRGGTPINRNICATIIKREPGIDFMIKQEPGIEPIHSPQIYNLTSIYRQPLSDTKDANLQSVIHNRGGLTPGSTCLSPITDVKPVISRPQV